MHRWTPDRARAVLRHGVVLRLRFRADAAKRLPARRAPTTDRSIRRP